MRSDLGKLETRMDGMETRMDGMEKKIEESATKSQRVVIAAIIATIEDPKRQQALLAGIRKIHSCIQGETGDCVLGG